MKVQARSHTSTTVGPHSLAKSLHAYPRVVESSSSFLLDLHYLSGLMARTRAQEHSDAPKPEYAPEGPKPQRRPMAKAEDNEKANGPKNKKRKSKNASGEKTKEGQAPASKKTKTEDTTTSEDSKPKSPAVDKSKLDALLSKYGALPLQDTSLPNQNEPTPETVLSLLYLAMLTSARISHELAYKTVQCVIEAGYYDIGRLRKSTWQERTEVLTKGGYTRYREKTATALGELAEFIGKEYGALYFQSGLSTKPATDFFYEGRRRSQQSPQESRLLSRTSSEIDPRDQRHRQGWYGHLFRRCTRYLAISGTVHRP